MNIFTTLLILIGGYIEVTKGVLEQQRENDGTYVWKTGVYRNRNVVPLPPNYDAKRKHRDLSDQDPLETEDSNPEYSVKQHHDKKNLIRAPKKGKKSRVPKVVREEKRKMRIEDSPEFVPIIFNSAESRSKVPSTWGMTWKNLKPEVEKDSNGVSRSELAAASKIREEDLDDGLMFRGLGGQSLRAQNEALIEGKFQDQSEDEDYQNNKEETLSARRDIKKHTVVQAAHEKGHVSSSKTDKANKQMISIPLLKHKGSIDETGFERAIYSKAFEKKSQKGKGHLGLENLFTKFLLLFRRGKVQEIKKDPRLMALYKRMNLDQRSP